MVKIFIKNPVCQHFNQCSGCELDLTLSYPPIWNDVIVYFRDKCAFEPKLYKSLQTGWRCRAKLAVRGSSTHALIGLFKEGTHEVIPIPFCQVHHPSINRAIEYVRSFIQSHHLLPYQEQTGQGDLRYLQFVVERQTGKIQASFVLNFKSFSDPRCQKWLQLIKKLKDEKQDSFWHSLWLNLNHQKTNTIFGNQWHLCWGEKFLWETFDNISVCFQPASFAQANMDLFEQMLKRIKKLVPHRSQVVEFYAGVGVIGLALASKCEWIKCAEINPQAEECFIHSKNRMPLADAARISFHTGATSQLLNILQEADLVIVDPPRKGLDASLLEALNQSPSVRQLIYVSCGWASFKKDCDYLLSKGWRLDQGEGYLFFPGSNHIEILASFNRSF